MKVLRYILFGSVLLVILVTLILYQILKIQYVSKLIYKQGEIQISRGEHNIPEIHAYSLESALYAWGYTTAEDRLFQLALRRASIKGQLSQYFGIRTIVFDKLFRTLNLYGWAQRSSQRFKKQNFSQYNIWKAYADGINDYYNTLTFNQIQFQLTGFKWQPWTVTDMFAMQKLIKWTLSDGIIDEYIRSMMLANNYSFELIKNILPFEQKHWLEEGNFKHTTIIKDKQIPLDLSFHGQTTNKSKFNPVPVKKLLPLQMLQQTDVSERASNSWVISGNHTQSGHVLICNDPHLQSALPGEWYQIKIFYPDPHGLGELYLIAASMIGIPLFVGKSSFISITMTANYIDSQDLYKQQINGTNYLLDGQWIPLKIRTQIIKVKGYDSIHYNVYENHRGPLIKYCVSRGYLYEITENVSLKWVGFTDEQHHSLSQYVHLAEVKTYQQFLQTIREKSDDGPFFNLIYSTQDDHIGYLATGKFPLRRHPHMGMFVQDGSISENDWLGFIKGKDKLHLEDPQRGFISSANNKAAPFSYYNGIFDIGKYTGRANRIENLIQEQLKAGKKINKLFMRNMQLDTIDVFCLEIVKDMKNKKSKNQSNYKFYEVIEEFDCNFSTNSNSAAIYLSFIQNVYEEQNPSIYNNKYNLGTSHQFYQYIYHFLLKNHTKQQLIKLQNSMSEGLAEVRKFFKSNNSKDYIYGQFHKDRMIHRPFSFVKLFRPFVENLLPGFGNMNTVNVGFINRFHSKNYQTNHRANLRLIMSYYEDSEWIIDGGSSEKWYSQYYKDQTSKFFSGRYLIMDAANRTLPIY